MWEWKPNRWNEKEETGCTLPQSMEVENGHLQHWFPLQHSHLMSLPTSGGKGMKIHPPRNQRTLMPSPPWCLGPMRLLELAFLRFFCSIYVSWFLDDPGISTPNLWYQFISFISICQACWVLLDHTKILPGPQATKCSSTARLVASTAGTEAAWRKSTHGDWNDCGKGVARIKLENWNAW